MMGSEHDQLVRLQERVKIFREHLENSISLSIDLPREIRCQILEWFDEIVADKQSTDTPHWAREVSYPDKLSERDLRANKVRDNSVVEGEL